MIERKPFFIELLKNNKVKILQQLDRRDASATKELEAILISRNTYPQGNYIIDIKDTNNGK